MCCSPARLARLKAEDTLTRAQLLESKRLAKVGGEQSLDVDWGWLAQPPLAIESAWPWPHLPLSTCGYQSLSLLPCVSLTMHAIVSGFLASMREALTSYVVCHAGAVGLCERLSSGCGPSAGSAASDPGKCRLGMM